MADAVTDPKELRVHQCLHGYADGHRLIATSKTVNPKDAKTMLIMSDASGRGTAIGKSGYLTGYPLTESGLYALARTWPATEITRPGCVWTHTILIEFADLAKLNSLRALRNVFRRPSEANPTIRFEDSTLIRLDSDLLGFDPGQHQEAVQRLLWGLYGHPSMRVIATADEFSEQYVLLCWSQQWPRLRRGFRFCTLSFADRSSENSSFDLQFIPSHERNVKSRFSKTFEADKGPVGQHQWLDDAFRDLTSATGTKLRLFLREVGGETPGGREAFVPLCNLHSLVEQSANLPSAIDKAIRLLDDAFEKGAASSARSVIAAAIATNPIQMSDAALSFLFANIKLLPDKVITDNCVSIGQTLWLRSPSSLLDLLSSTAPARIIAERTLASIQLEDLWAGNFTHSEFLPDILRLQPHLVEEARFWKSLAGAEPAAFQFVANHPLLIDTALRAIIKADRSDFGSEVLKYFGNIQVMRALEVNALDTPALLLSRWLDILLRDTDSISELFRRGVLKHRRTLFAIACRTDPDYLPDYGDNEDPWLVALRNTEDDLTESERHSISSYLLSRAFGHRSVSQAELMVESFDNVYFAALRSQLGEEAWSYLHHRLPKAPWWADWDRCKRLRIGVVDAFVHRSLSPQTFLKLTKNDDLFYELAEMAYDLGRDGKYYIRRVQRVARKSDSASSGQQAILSRFK